jgi:hypothetical protein
MWIHGPHVSEGTRITGQSVVCSHQLRGRRCSAPQSMTFLTREKNTHRICGSRRVRGLFGSPPHFDTAKFVAATEEKATALFRLNLRLLQLLQVLFSPKVWHQKRMPHFVAASSAWQPVTANQTSPRSLKQATTFSFVAATSFGGAKCGGNQTHTKSLTLAGDHGQ